MPTQSPANIGTAYYSQHDTAPAYRRQLLEPDGSPIDLTNASTVTITIGHLRGDHYYSPYTLLVPRAPVTIENPRTNGWVNWGPGSTPGVNALHLPGNFDLIFEINWNDATRQTVPAHTYEKIRVTTKPGGFEQL